MELTKGCSFNLALLIKTGNRKNLFSLQGAVVVVVVLEKKYNASRIPSGGIWLEKKTKL